MRYQHTFVVAIVSLVAIAAAEALAAGPGVFRSRNGSGNQPVKRSYRSYSVNPSTPSPAETTPIWADGNDATSRPAPSTPGGTRKSKPSYMRADSKASGRFGQ